MSAANVSVWFEIPTRDLSRAKRFYDLVFGVSLKSDSVRRIDRVLERSSELVRWTGADPNKDTLTYEVLVSSDGGATWKPAGEGAKGKEQSAKSEEQPRAVALAPRSTRDAHARARPRHPSALAARPA